MSKLITAFVLILVFGCVSITPQKASVQSQEETSTFTFAVQNGFPYEVIGEVSMLDDFDRIDGREIIKQGEEKIFWTYFYELNSESEEFFYRILSPSGLLIEKGSHPTPPNRGWENNMKSLTVQIVQLGPQYSLDLVVSNQMPYPITFEFSFWEDFSRPLGKYLMGGKQERYLWTYEYHTLIEEGKIANDDELVIIFWRVRNFDDEIIREGSDVMPNRVGDKKFTLTIE